MSVPFHRPGSGPPSDDRPHEPLPGALRHVTRTHSRARRWFLAVNGAAFLLTALPSGAAGELFATRPVIGTPLGVVLGALQLAVLLLTSWQYDRTLRRRADPLLDSVRRPAGLVQPALPQPGPAKALSPRPFPSQGRQG